VWLNYILYKSPWALHSVAASKADTQAKTEGMVIYATSAYYVLLPFVLPQVPTTVPTAESM